MDKKICTVCWKEYMRRHGWNINEFEISKFCSKKCFHDSWRKKSECIICQNTFFTPKCQYWKVICCSKECTKKRRSENAIRRQIDKKDWFGKMWEDWMIEKNPRWKPIGTKKHDWHGYILIKIADGEWFKNWIQEHVHNIEQDIGRKLDLKKECVHHIDGIKQNNELSNLFLTTQNYHKKLHQSIFMDTVKELLDKKIVYFDRGEKKYKIREDIQLTFSS